VRSPCPFRRMARIVTKIVALGLLCSASVSTSPLRAAGTEDRRLTPAQTPIPANYFGIHLLHLKGTAPNYDMPWPEVPVPADRLWDAKVTWQDLEAAKGRWNFDVLDKVVKLAQEHNSEVQLTFGFTPRWASARPSEASLYQPGNAAEPTSMEDWKDFVRTVATRYRNQIHIYEIWNEPNVHRYWSGSVEQMVDMAHQAFDIIKSIDPSAVVVSPAPAGQSGLLWFSSFLNAGGGRYADVIGYHFYVDPAPPEAMVPLVQSVQAIMRGLGVGKKQLWDTEAGWAQPHPFPSDQLGAAYLARAFLLNWATGIRRFYWYAWVSWGLFLPMTQPDQQILTPEGKAFGAIQAWMAGTVMNWCQQDENGTWTCQMRDRTANKWVVWNPDQNICVNIPPAWHVKESTPLLSETSPLGAKCLLATSTPQLLTQ
jgi:hypothetical protein